MTQERGLGDVRVCTSESERKRLFCIQGIPVVDTELTEIGRSKKKITKSDILLQSEQKDRGGDFTFVVFLPLKEISRERGSRVAWQTSRHYSESVVNNSLTYLHGGMSQFVDLQSPGLLPPQGLSLVS